VFRKKRRIAAGERGRRCANVRSMSTAVPMMRWLGNMLAIVGGLVGVVAAVLWWLAADLPASADFSAIAAAIKSAALVTAISAILIATGEILRGVSRRRRYFQ